MSGTDLTGDGVTQQDTDPERQHANGQDGGILSGSTELREATDIGDRSPRPTVAASGTRGTSSGSFGALSDKSRQFVWNPTLLAYRPPLR